MGVGTPLAGVEPGVEDTRTHCKTGVVRAYDRDLAVTARPERHDCDRHNKGRSIRRRPTDDRG
jgi:hypothetical protein